MLFRSVHTSADNNWQSSSPHSLTALFVVQGDGQSLHGCHGNKLCWLYEHYHQPYVRFSHSPIAARPRTGEGHVWPVSRVSVEEEATRIVSKGHEDLQ